ncbi:MAG: hypothetical protein K0Q95_250 [Bacteroidota bacterium]|jgi:hypothetical protein|nr:hypothetical protein [Bacteroidota bacterium]
MKGKLLLITALATQLLNAQHQINWAKQMDPGTAASGIQSFQIGTDASGNVYTAGQFTGTVDFDPGPGVVNMSTPTGQGGGYIYISKLSPTGDFLWAKQFTGSTNMYPKAMAVSATGDVYVSGTFGNTVDFDPGSGTAQLTAMSPDDIFICRLDAAGDFVWVKHVGSAGYESVSSMEFAQDGGLLLSGFGDAVTDYDPGAPVLYLGDGGFIIKLTTSGNLVWATPLNGIATAVDVTADGTIYQTGSDMSYMTLNKLDASGTLLWTKMFTGGYMTSGDVTHDDAGNIYMSGNFDYIATWGTGTGETLNSTGSRDAFIIKFDQAGTTLDAWTIEGPGYSAIDLLQFDNGRLTAAGYFSGPTDLDPGTGVSTVNTNPTSWSDIAILTLSPAGMLQCLSAIGSGQPDYPTALTFTSDGKLLITGQIGDTTDMDPGSGTSMLYQPSNFIAKYELCQMIAGVEDVKSPTVSCYPNPASDIINITANGNWILNIYSVEGKLVKQLRSSDTKEVDISDLMNGIYTISIVQNKTTSYQKLIISK